MDSSVNELFRRATNLQRQNRMEDAIATYAVLLRRDPTHLRGLNRLGNCLLAIGKHAEALQFFRQACSVDDSSAISHLNLGRALIAAGQSAAAGPPLARAVALDRNLAMAWLHLGTLPTTPEESALLCLHKAFELNPSLRDLPSQAAAPEDLRKRIARGLRALNKHYRELHQQTFAALEQDHGRASLSRVSACLDIQHGKIRPGFDHPLQRPESIFFPGLAPRAFFAASEFAWSGELEARGRAIREEFLSARNDADFTPYVPAGPGVPPAMANLSGSHDWDAMHLFVGGERRAENCARYPVTAETLSRLPMAQLAGVAPEAFFSVLRPGAHIRPHYGISNIKLAVHLALLVPGDCGIRVGEETRTWHPERCLIFDDSFEHEAWNRSSEIRVVLIFEVWNPQLTAAETDALCRLSASIDDWARASDPARDPAPATSR